MAEELLKQGMFNAKGAEGAKGNRGKVNHEKHEKHESNTENEEIINTSQRIIAWNANIR